MQAMQNLWIRESESFLIVYDITLRETYENAQNVFHDIQKIKGNEPFCVVLAGNKCDLEEQRQVSKQEPIDFAKENGIQFLETSAKKKINSEACFFDLIRQYAKIRPFDPNYESEQTSHCCEIL